MKEKHSTGFVAEVSQAIKNGNNDGKEWNGLVDRYQGVIRDTEDGNKWSRKLGLDLCYTVIMWVLEIQAKKQISISKNVGK